MASKPTLEGADGVTLTSTGLVVLREHAEFVDSVFSGEATDKPRAFRFVVTLNHEGVHFLQCLTAAFPYSFSLSLLQLASQIMELSRSKKLTRAVIGTMKETFASYVAHFRSPFRGVSTIDLLEAMAVTESYRATATSEYNDAKAFRQFLLEYFPQRDSEYRRVIDLITRVFGVDAGYHLTPRLCYIALNGDHPAKNFHVFVDGLAADRPNDAHKMTGVEIIKCFGMSLSSSLLSMCERELPSDASHPVFAPYMQYLSKIGSLEERYEFCAQPGTWYRGDGPNGIGELVPPLVVCSGGRGKVMGLARNWAPDRLFTYLDCAALIGACIVLLTGDKHYQACQHAECPIHESTLCHAWYAKPHAIPWEQCAFPTRVKVQFGVEGGQLTSLFS